MKFNNMTALRSYLEQMETQQLDAMLREEVKKEAPDGQLVRQIGCILKEREKDVVPEIDEQIQEAWEQYQQKTASVHKRSGILNTWVVRAASLLLVLLTFLAVLPGKASAGSFFERVIAWTEDVFSLVNPAEATVREEEYVFRTENPGLQEVYDRVTELGITAPVVPMWIPEEYELVECKVNHNPTRQYLTASFSDGTINMAYQISVYTDNVTREYFKKNTDTMTYEQNGINHVVLRNQNWWTTIWTVGKIECFIQIDCPEDILIRILESIYTMEE